MSGDLEIKKLKEKFEGKSEESSSADLASETKETKSEDIVVSESTEQSDSFSSILAEDGAINVEPKIDSLGRAYATGRRKSSVARVWIKPGKGGFTVNKRELNNYFSRQVLRTIVNQPFVVAGREGEFSVMCTVRGGGISGQAGAIRHGIARALVSFEPTLRAKVKSAGLLTRDAREVERKKYGLRKARRSFQFSKR